MNKYKTFNLKSIQAPNFLMTALELKDYIDFPVKRIYFLSEPRELYRTGNHAHRQDEDEIFIQVQGTCLIGVDDGSGLQDIKLETFHGNSEDKVNAIYVPHMVWHGFRELSPDCIILAVTSTNYDPERKDYIEDYEEFKKIIADNQRE